MMNATVARMTSHANVSVRTLRRRGGASLNSPSGSGGGLDVMNCSCHGKGRVSPPPPRSYYESTLMNPTTFIIRTAGTNCDRELARAFELAGAATQTLHLNELIADPSLLQRADLVGFPGGFSYGDDI